MSQIFIILIILFFSYVLPSVKKEANKASIRKGSGAKGRNPRDYGNIVLDGKVISMRNKGVVDPSAMYSDSKRAQEQGIR